MDVTEFRNKAKRAVWIEHYARITGVLGCLAILLPIFMFYDWVLSFGLAAYSVMAGVFGAVLIAGYYYLAFSFPFKAGLYCKACGWRLFPAMSAWRTVELITASKSCPGCGSTIIASRAGSSNKAKQ
jgi:hypothetical protein